MRTIYKKVVGKPDWLDASGMANIYSVNLSTECSPLSCNSLANQIPVFRRSKSGA